MLICNIIADHRANGAALNKVIELKIPCGYAGTSRRGVCAIFHGSVIENDEGL